MKEKFYNILVGLTAKTGQGFPSGLQDRIGARKAIEELIKEGRVKEVTMGSIGHAFICLTGVYCVEEESNTKCISFLRHFLGVKDSVNDQIIENNKKEYAAWKVNNKEGIGAIKLLTVEA